MTAPAWFRSTDTGKAHAFEFVDGELYTVSVCGFVGVDDCEDTVTSSAVRACAMCSVLVLPLVAQA